MNNFLKSIVLVLFFAPAFAVHGQQNIKRQKIAVFAPLFLDDAFRKDSTYRFAKNEFPGHINPGLEFYEGVQIAIDSFSKKNIPFEVFVYDSRSQQQSVLQQLAATERDSVDMILAYTSSADVKTFADAGLKRNIPVININLPNDAGIFANPFYVLLNPTLRTQCEGIYKFIAKNFSNKDVIVFKKQGALEDRIKMYFDDFKKTTTTDKIKLKYIDLGDSTINLKTLAAQLDTVSNTVCIVGSLDEKFGKKIASSLATLSQKNLRSSLIGMPTWDNISDFRRPEYKGVDIYYGTPFYNSRDDKTSRQIIDNFNKTMFARPSDMVMRGYETMWRFGNLLWQYKKDIASNLSNKNFNVFRDFDIQPVLNRQTTVLDYFENKKLYFMKWQGGVLRLAE